MFFVYALKSHSNGLWYVGLTSNLKRRVQAHKNLRPDLYANGMTVKVIGRRKTLAAVGALERATIRQKKTLWPYGNNLREGGLSGRLLRFARENGNKATYKLLQQNASPWMQRVRDNIAAARIRNRLLSGRPLKKSSLACQKSRAWKRQDQGLQPIPGTEHWLLMPRVRKGVMTADMREKFCAAQKVASYLRWEKRRAEGKDRPHNFGVAWAESQRTRIAEARILNGIRRGVALSYTSIVDAVAKARARQSRGLDPIAGTEMFLGLQLSMKGPASQIERRAFRVALAKRVNAWRQKFASKAAR